MYGVLNPGDEGWVAMIGVPDGDTLNRLVGGPFEAIRWAELPGGLEVTLWVHEEGKLLQLDPSIDIVTSSGEPLDVLVGPVVATRSDLNTGELVGLKKDDFANWLKPLPVVAMRQIGDRCHTNAVLEVRQ